MSAARTASLERQTSESKVFLTSTSMAPVVPKSRPESDSSITC